MLKVGGAPVHLDHNNIRESQRMRACQGKLAKRAFLGRKEERWETKSGQINKSGHS